MVSAPASAIAVPATPKGHAGSRDVLNEAAGNELVFAVVGHVGSGTSAVAEMLAGVLRRKDLPDGPYDVTVLKARDEIANWAKAHGKQTPTPDLGNFKTAQMLQDRGDEMRAEDHAAVARALAVRIRRTRAAKQGQSADDNGAVFPDGARRAYILDSIRHPAEARFLRDLYRGAFALVGVVCEDEERQRRLVHEKYKDAPVEAAEAFMARDANAADKHGQHVSAAFQLADFFIDNTPERIRGPMKTANPDWDIAEQLSRLVKIITHATVERPTIEETALYAAHGAKLRSACMSRQVGAALVDASGNIIATGTNEVPKAGGGLYGQAFEPLTRAEDHRCIYRELPATEPLPYCSNTREQNRIIDEVIAAIPELKTAAAKDLESMRTRLRKSPIGALLEFSRAVHAEMDALLSAGRTGASTVGTRLFVTTFPCHYCARHLVAAGVEQIQYVEAYDKSKALALHADSIVTNERNWKPFNQIKRDDKGQEERRTVLVQPFVGVAPQLRVPDQAGQRFRPMSDTDSGACRTVIPGHLGHPIVVG